MTARAIDILKSYWAKGRVPTEKNYIDLIDTIFSIAGGGGISSIDGGPDIVVDGSTVSRSGNQILLFRSSGDPLEAWSPTTENLFAALDAGVSGDIILLPPCVIESLANSSRYTADEEIANGPIALTSEEGTLIPGLEIGQWYAVETYNGYASVGPDWPFVCTNLSLNNGTGGFSGNYGRAVGGDRVPFMNLDLPDWSPYGEIINDYYPRVYFQATTTSIHIRLPDGPGEFSDNRGTLNWRLLNTVIAPMLYIKPGLELIGTGYNSVIYGSVDNDGKLSNLTVTNVVTGDGVYQIFNANKDLVTNHRIQGITPVNAKDLATKHYVDLSVPDLSDLGDIFGPDESVDGHLAVFDGITGKLVRDGGAVPIPDIGMHNPMISPGDIIYGQDGGNQLLAALGASVTGNSGQYSGNWNNTIDDDDGSSVWTNNQQDPYVTFDLGSPKEIGRMILKQLWDRRIDTFRLEYSLDGSSWIQMPVQTTTSDNFAYTFPVAIMARYWKFQGISGSSGGMIIYTIQLIVIDAGSPLALPIGNEDQILAVVDGKPSWVDAEFSSSGDVNGPGESIDGHLAIFDGTSGKLIKDGGAIPTGGGGSGVTLPEPPDPTLFLNGEGDWAVPDGSGGISTLDGWIDTSETWTYSGADDPNYTLTIPGDKSNKYSPGMKVNLIQSTIKYFIVQKVEYSSPNTILTLYGGIDYDLTSDPIASPQYSREKAPFGFPLDETKWTYEIVDVVDYTIVNPNPNSWYNARSLELPIGIWNVDILCWGYANANSDINVSIWIALSTTNNGNSSLKLMNVISGRRVTGGTLYFGDTLNLLSKTTYYLNYQTSDYTVASINIFGTVVQPTYIRLRCAYL